MDVVLKDPLLMDQLRVGPMEVRAERRELLARLNSPKCLLEGVVFAGCVVRG